MKIQRTVQILKKSVVMASVLSVGLTASAATNYWDGNLSTAWNTSVQNWKTLASGGSSTAFTTGNDVVFGVTSPTTQTVVVDPSGVSVGLFTINSGTAWNFSGGKITASISGATHIIARDTTFTDMAVNLNRVHAAGQTAGVTISANVTLTSSTAKSSVWRGPYLSFTMGDDKTLTLAGYAVLDADEIPSKPTQNGKIIINDNAVLKGNYFGISGASGRSLHPIDLNGGALYGKTLQAAGGAVALSWSGGVVRPTDGDGLRSTFNASGAISTFTLDGTGGGTFDGRDFTGEESSITLDNDITETGGSYGIRLVGGGTLTLNGTNTYTGATLVSNGVLRITHAQCLSTNTDLYVWSGATNDLAFAGTNTLHALYVNGTQKRAGLYNTNNLPVSMFSGGGHLRVTSGSTTGTMIRIF